MKRWSGWASRPLVAAVLMMLAAPVALVRPEPSRTVPPVIEDCPRRLLRAGPAAAEPGVSMAVITGGRLRTCVAGSRDAWSGRAVTGSVRVSSPNRRAPYPGRHQATAADHAASASAVDRRPIRTSIAMPVTN
jgi:hypothetical protein